MVSKPFIKYIVSGNNNPEKSSFHKSLKITLSMNSFYGFQIPFESFFLDA
jgi:hypothetical protein